MKELGVIDDKWPLSNRSMNASWEELPEHPLPKQFEQIKVVNKDNLHAFMSMKMEIYAAQVDRMDQGIAKIVKCLEDNNIMENTMIIFLADNGGCAEYGNYGGLVAKKDHNTFKDNGGPLSYDSYGAGWACASNTPFRYYKHYIHEGGISTPFIVHWPAKAKSDGNIRKQVGHIIDIMPTMLDAAGGKYPTEHEGNKIKPMEGTSLLPAITANDPIDHEYICWEHHGNRAIRMGDWKLVAKGEKSPWELYNIIEDRTEMNDLVSKKPKLVKDMNDKWWAWAKRCDVLPMNPNRKGEFLKRRLKGQAKKKAREKAAAEKLKKNNK